MGANIFKRLTIGLWDFIKKESITVVAGVLALMSLFFVPSLKDSLKNIDLNVLALLFSLMVVVEGFKESGVFDAMQGFLQDKFRSMKGMGIALAMVCFFTAMFVTNDVALITFVPFTIGLLKHNRKYLLFVIVMETVAANLGSMVTPVGNPQNLLLYEFYRLSTPAFMKMMLPLGGICLALILLIMMPVKGGGDVIAEATGTKESKKANKNKSMIYGVLFLVSLLAVFHVIKVSICLAIMIVVVFFVSRRLLLKPDYMLLLTFCFFFIFSGNMKEIEQVRLLTEAFIKGREITASAAISQIISNVPAAALLAPFTDKAKELLFGVNIGGLGTPVASLASLISYKAVAGEKGLPKGKYLMVFSLVNFPLLAILLIIASFL